MAVNKVDVNGVTVLDLTQDSVTPATLKKGETAHDASGTAIVGEMESGGGGSFETCTLTTSVGKAPGLVHGTIYAYSGDTLITITSKGTYSINKNSLIYIDGAARTNEFTGLEQLYYGYGESVCNVTSDIATYKFTM